MSEWREVTLAQVCDRVDYGYTASASDEPSLPRFLRITDIAVPSIDWGQVPGCRVDAKTLPKYKLENDDIVVARTGATVGYAKRVRNHPESVFASYLVRFRPMPGVDGAFLGAVVDSASYREWVATNAGGAAQPNANAKVLGAYPFRIPDRSTQTRIGRFADSIDDLIENNRRRVAILEEMARELYREWFVHFRYPGHESVPLVDSELGPIPEGWEPASVAALSSTLSRGIAPSYAEDGAWTVVNQKCIRDERVSLAPSRRQEKDVPRAKRVAFGDVLINSTGIGTLGRVAMYRGHHGSLTVDSHVTIARPSDPELNPWYGLALTTKSADFVQLSTGSTGQTELGREAIGSVSVVQPSRDILRRFADQAWPQLMMIEPLLDQAAALAAMRDLLLPKLVTGQIDVSALDLADPVADQCQASPAR